MQGVTILPGFLRAVTSAGATWQCTWQGITSGQPRFAPPSAVLPRVPNLPPVAALPDGHWGAQPPPLEERQRRLIQMVVESVAPRLEDLRAVQPEVAISVVVATSHGESGAVTQVVESLDAGVTPSEAAVRGVLIDYSISACCAGLRCNVPGITLAAACASGIAGLEVAASQIAYGLADAVLVVGADVLSRVATVGFSQIKATSRVGCMPFDERRDGTTIGEGAATVLLASERVRQASEEDGSEGDVFRLAGYGCSIEPGSYVEPSVDGIVRAITLALVDAQVAPADVDFVIWHGTGTRQNDAAEAAAAQRVFQPVPLGVAIKGTVGHLMGASGVLGVACACESLRTGCIPGAPWLIQPAFAHLNVSPQVRRLERAGVALVVALGFGGINTAAVVTRRAAGDAARSGWMA